MALLRLVSFFAFFETLRYDMLRRRIKGYGQGRPESLAGKDDGTGQNSERRYDSALDSSLFF